MFVMLLISFQGWVVYSNYCGEERLLIRNLNESVQAALDVYYTYDLGADSMAHALRVKTSKPDTAGVYAEEDNLIANPDFELGDTLFSTDYQKREQLLGAQVASKNGWQLVTTNAESITLQWHGSGFGGQGDLLTMDGATNPDRTAWRQNVKVTPGHRYSFGVQLATLSRSNINTEHFPAWELAILKIEINNQACGYIAAPKDTNGWTSINVEWFSGEDSLAAIRILDLNTASRYNDFAIDHLHFVDEGVVDASFGTIQNEAVVVNPEQLILSRTAEEDSVMLCSILEEEFRFRGVDCEYELVLIPSQQIEEREADNFSKYLDPIGKYYLVHYIEKGKLFSTYFFVNKYYQCKCALLDFRPLLFRKISGQLLLLIVSIVISVGAIYFTYRFLRKREQLDELKYDITSSITHELKTPVATILAATESLQKNWKSNDAEKTERYLEITRNQATRLNNLIEKALTYSEVEEEGFALNLQKTSVSDLVNEVASSDEIAQHNGVKLKVNLPETPIYLQVDSFHVRNILHTLVDNSLKYGGEKIQISFDVRKLNDVVEISIVDNGPGVPLEYQKTIFEKYFRVPTNDRYNVKGHGLGLYYVKTIMSLHGGTANIKSDGNSGTEIILKFPLLK